MKFCEKTAQGKHLAVWAMYHPVIGAHLTCQRHLGITCTEMMAEIERPGELCDVKWISIERVPKRTRK